MPTVSELVSKRIGNTITNSQTWGGILYNVKSYGAVGNGVTDDTAAIQAAINAATAAGGGIVWIPYGRFKISTTLTINGTVSLQGAGSDSTDMDSFTALTDAVSALVWAGGASVAINITGMVGGVDWRDFVVDGANLATIGISIDQLRNSTWVNVKVIRCVTYGVKILPVDGGVANQNTMFNSFINVAILRCPTPLYLEGTGISNVCHNSFVNLHVDFSGGDGIYFGDTDNNVFTQTYCYKRSGSGYGVRFSASARSNYFYNFQGDMKCLSGSKNIVFGFDRENGQPRPTVDTGAQLFWTENGNNATGWRMTSGIEGITALLTGDNTYAVNATPDTTLWKMFRSDTNQQLSISFVDSGRKAIHKYYDGSSPAEIEYMNVGILGIEFYHMGGKKITYGSAAPTTGTWNQGDTVHNTAPTAGGFMGWVCVTGGTPGTWKTFGAITA